MPDIENNPSLMSRIFYKVRSRYHNEIFTDRVYIINKEKHVCVTLTIIKVITYLCASLSQT